MTRQGSTLASGDTASEQLVVRADDYFDGLVADLTRARSRIDMEAYIFADDAVGQRVIKALCRAAERGVDVRLLVDGAGSPWTVSSLLQRLQQAGGRGRIYHPLPWRFWHWTLASNRHALPLRLLHLLSWINRRNHRKACMIDRRVVWLGSFNVTVDHLPEDSEGRGWRDTAVRLETTNVRELSRAFTRAWEHPSLVSRRSNVPMSGQFMLNYTRQLRRLHHRRVLRHIGRARRRIWITNAYFLPDSRLLRSLCIAARRGVDVRILLPGHSDLFFIPWAASHFYRQLLSYGVRIFEYQPSVLHAKTLLIDDWGTVGSSNLNHRSLLHDLEVDVVLGQRHNIEALGEQFLRDLGQTEEVGSEGHRKLVWWKRLIGRLALLVRYWT